MTGLRLTVALGATVALLYVGAVAIIVRIAQGIPDGDGQY